MEHMLRDTTHSICQGAQEKYDDRNDDTGMLSSPVTYDMSLYRWNKGGAKACFVNEEAMCNIACHNRGAKVRKGDGGSTVRGARNRGWCRDVNYAAIWLVVGLRCVLFRVERRNTLKV